ncbi:type II toxin-antitoxin system HicB family antitoxin [Halosimplex sp. J119]
MASATDDSEGDGPDGIEFVREDDGTITARDLETGLARGGDSRAEALAQLAEVLELHEGGGEPIENPDEFLREELDVEPDERDGDEPLPEFLR